MMRILIALTLLALIGVSMAQLWAYDVYNVHPANGYGPGQLNTGIQQWGREYTVPRNPLNSYVPLVYGYRR